MKQPAESPHLKISNDRQILSDMFKYHLENQHGGSIVSMKRLREEVRRKKKTIQFKLIKPFLLKNKDFNSLSEEDQKRCKRRVSSRASDMIDDWIVQYETPQVSNDVSGLEACFKIEEGKTEVDSIIRLSDKFSYIESPSGWKVSR
jgi:hypothetical protein